MLQISLMGAIIGYSLIPAAVWATSLPLLFFSRLPIGLCKQTQTVARAVTSDCTSLTDRRSALARLGVATGAGFIIGPAIGGIISARAPLVPPIIAVCLFLVALAIVTVSLPETSPKMRTDLPPKRKQDATDASSEDGEGEQLTGFSPSKYPQVMRILGARCLVDVAYLMVETTFAIYTTQRFNLAAKQTGLVLSYAGLLTVLMQLVAIPRMHGLMSEHSMLIAGASTLAVALGCIAAAGTMPLFLAAIAILAIGRALFRTATDTVITKCALPEDNGAVSGASDAAESVCRVIAPAVGGFLMQWYGSTAPALGGAIAALAGTLALHLALRWAVSDAATPVEKKIQ